MNSGIVQCFKGPRKAAYKCNHHYYYYSCTVVHVASVQILKHAVASPLLTDKGQLGNTRSCYDVILTLTTYLSIVVQTMYQQA